MIITVLLSLVIVFFVQFSLCPFALANLFPAFGAIIDVWQNFLIGFVTAIVRFVLATILAVLQGDEDFFLDFTLGIKRDSFWATTTKMVALLINVLDLIVAPIVWRENGREPNIDNIDTQTPLEYPTNLKGPLEDFIGNDIYSDVLQSGAAGNIPTLAETLRFSVEFGFVGGFVSDMLCPLIRGTRVIISGVVIVLDLLARIATSLSNPSQADVLLYQWFFNCPVPAAARSYGFQNLQTNPVSASAITTASCADTDGILIAFVQLFRCPCEWLGGLRFGPLKCLCAAESYSPVLNVSAGSGILTSFAELLAEVARVSMVLLRRGLAFNGAISISGEIVAPIMVAVTRAMYASSCIMVSIFGDDCSQVKWRRVIESSGRIIFSAPFFMAGLLDRTMQNAITVSQNEYKGGMRDFSFVGYNTFYIDNNNPAQCAKSVNPRSCGRSKNHNEPKTTDPGQSGAFTFIAQLIYPFTQIIIDVLKFVDCAIRFSLSRIPGGSGIGKVTTATIGALIEIATVGQSVFFSILHFAWQMFELLTWFFTRDVGGWSTPGKAARLAYRLFKNIIRSLKGHPADLHTYWEYPEDEGRFDDCLDSSVVNLLSSSIDIAIAEVPPDPVKIASLTTQRDDAFTACLTAGRDSAGAPLNYLWPDKDVSKRRGANDRHYGDSFSSSEARETLATMILGNKHAKSLSSKRGASIMTPEDKELWKQVSILSQSIDHKLYGTEPLNAIASMANRFNQEPCRHENIAACICPWEPEIAIGTDLCDPNRPGGYTVSDEKSLLQRSALFSFNGNTDCDDLVLHMSLDDHWDTADYGKKERLARCLNDRAIGVHYAKEFCAELDDNDICMWPRNLWYQPDRWSAWLKAQTMVDAYEKLKPAHLHKEKVRLMSHKRARDLWEATRIPEETWNATQIPYDATYTDTPNGRGRRRRSAPNEEIMASLERASARYRRQQRHRNAVEYEKTGDIAFLQQVKHNLTHNEYDTETLRWLKGEIDMPLDIVMRPHGSTLMTHVVTYGSPCLLPKPDVHYRSREWRRGEYDGDAELLNDIRTGNKTDMDNYILEHYNSTTLSGYRIPSAVHRRELLYVLRGWEAFSGMVHQRNQPQFKRRSMEENLSTFEARRDSRLKRVSHLAQRVGAVGVVARDVHNIAPSAQQVHLNGAMAVDYLVYGAMSGAFKDGIKRYNEATPEEIQKTKPTAWQFLSNTHVRWSNDWDMLNEMMSNSGSLPPNDIPGRVWNTTYSLLTSVFGGEEDPSVFKASRRARGMSSPDERGAWEFEHEEGSSEFRQSHPRAREIELEREERAERIRQEARHNQRLLGLDPDYADHPVGLMDIIASNYRSPFVGNFTEPSTSWWGNQTATWTDQRLQPYTTGPVVVPELRHKVRAAVMLDQMDIYARTQDNMWGARKGRFAPTHQARFIFGGGCRIVTDILNDYLRVWSYCGTHTPIPVIPPPSVRSLDAQMAIYYPVSTANRGHQGHVHIARQTPRQPSPGASADYGPVFTELERIAKALDYLQETLFGWLGVLDLRGRLDTLFANSNGFWSNLNTDPNAGPVGALYYFREFSRCDFPGDVTCEAGVGAVQAVKDMLLWTIIAYGLVGYFLPWSIGMPILMLLPTVAAAIFSYHAWRYSPTCMTYALVPMCLVNEVNNVIKYFFRTCYDDLIPSYWTADGVVCPPEGTCIDFIDCRNLEINSGWAVIAGALRVLGKDIFGRFVSFVESFAVFGRHGPAPQAAEFLRATSNTMEFAGDKLVRQQNVCLVLNSVAVIPTAVTIFYGLILLGLLLTIGTFLVRWAFIMGPLVAGTIRFQRPEVIPGTGDIQEPILAVDD